MEVQATGAVNSVNLAAEPREISLLPGALCSCPFSLTLLFSSCVCALKHTRVLLTGQCLSI